MVWTQESSRRTACHHIIYRSFRPRLHERFFACGGDAIFLKIVASPARGENRMCSHPHRGDATDEKIAEKKSREIQWVEIFATKSQTSSQGGYTGDFHCTLATRQFKKNPITIASRKSMYMYNCKESNDSLSCGTKTPIEPGFHMSGKFQTIGDFCPKFSWLIIYPWLSWTVRDIIVIVLS